MVQPGHGIYEPGGHFPNPLLRTLFPKFLSDGTSNLGSISPSECQFRLRAGLVVQMEKADQPKAVSRVFQETTTTFSSFKYLTRNRVPEKPLRDFLRD